MILELPYIFGSMPGRISVWKPLIYCIRLTSDLFYIRGRANCIAVEDVSAAVAG